MARFGLCALVLVLVGCGGSVVRLPEEGDRSGAAGAASAPAGASGGGRAGRDPNLPSEPALGGASAGGASGTPLGGASGASAGGASGAPLGGAAGDPEPAAGAGGSDVPSAEPVRTLIQLPAKLRGFIAGVQHEPSATTAVYSLQADFENSRGRFDGCTQVTLGQCWYYDCPDGSQPYRVIGGSTLQNAGDLSATVSAAPNSPVQLAPLSDYYYEADANSALWSFDGGTLKFVASGAAVPAFSLEVATPPTVTLITLNGQPAPTMDSDEDGNPLPVAITRSAGVQLRWSSHGSGTAAFSLWGFEGHRFAAACEFDASVGHGELPAVLLQELEPGSAYNLTFRGTSLSQAKVGDWEIEVSLSAVGGPMSPFVRWPITLR